MDVDMGDMCADMCVDMCVGVCVDICADTCAATCACADLIEIIRIGPSNPTELAPLETQGMQKALYVQQRTPRLLSNGV